MAKTFCILSCFLITHIVIINDNHIYFAVPWVACASSPCSNGGTCVDVNVDTFICMCRDGYYGETCQYGKRLHILILTKFDTFFCCLHEKFSMSYKWFLIINVFAHNGFLCVPLTLFQPRPSQSFSATRM